MISGQVKRADLKGTAAFARGPQEVDIVAMVKGITKYAATIMDPADIRYHLEKAFYLATTGRRGPVWIDVPLDIQGGLVDTETFVASIPPRRISAGRRPAHISALVDVAKQVINLIKQAERPLFVIGHRCRLAGATTFCREMYETFDIPVATAWNAMDLIPADHPLSVGRPGGGRFAYA